MLIAGAFVMAQRDPTSQRFDLGAAFDKLDERWLPDVMVQYGCEYVWGLVHEVCSS